MTPQDPLQHSDTGELWPGGGGAVFAGVPSAYRSALALRALRISRGETPCGYKDRLHQTLAGTRIGFCTNGSLVDAGAGANVLDSPLQALLHFLKELRSCPGATDVVAGDIVTIGTWADVWPVCSGEKWTARFDLALPPLEVAFA